MKRLSLLALVAIPVVCLFYAYNWRWQGDDGKLWKTTICGDGYGYYAYLPCIFVHNKFDYNRVFEDEKKMNPDLTRRLGDLFPESNGKKCNKCFVGVAILLMPFFLLAYFLSHLLGYGTDGYSVLFQLSVSIGAIFYLFIGLFFLRKLLKEYSVDDGIIAFMLVLVVFATNLFYYTIVLPGLAHVYSFGVVAAFLYYVKKAMSEAKLKYLILIAVLLGLMTIIRPTNLLCVVMIPFIAGSMPHTVSFFKNYFRLNYIICGSIALLLVMGIQLLVWYAQTGQWFVWSYTGEAFYFNKPHLFGILLGYQNGWLIYTPVMLLSIASLILFFRENKFMFACLFIFIIFISYVLSSWWFWTYGGYGLRAYIDFYPCLILPVAMLFQQVKRQQVMSVSIWIFASLCLILNIIQTNQFQKGILSYGDMNQEKYWAVFMKTSNRYKGALSVPLVKDLSFPENAVFTNDFEHNTWGNDNNISTKYAHGGSHSGIIDSAHIYSPTLSVQCGTLPGQSPHFVYIDLWLYMENFDNDARLVVSIDSSGKSYFYTIRPLKAFMDKANRWEEKDFVIELPAFKSNNDKVSVYIFGTKGIVYFDDLVVKFCTFAAGKPYTASSCKTPPGPEGSKGNVVERRDVSSLPFFYQLKGFTCTTSISKSKGA